MSDKPKGESDFNIERMRLMDEHYTVHPFKGAKRMHTWLTIDKGYQASRHRVERFYYNVMGVGLLHLGEIPQKAIKRIRLIPTYYRI